MGLISALFFLILSTNLQAEIIWENKEHNEFSFNDYNELFFFIGLPQNLNSYAIESLKNQFKSIAHIEEIDLDKLPQIMNAMEKTHMLFHILLQKTENAQTNLLQVYVTTPARAIFSSASFSSQPWRREYIITNPEEDSKTALNMALADFFERYSPSAKKKAKFYIPTTK